MLELIEMTKCLTSVSVNQAMLQKWFENLIPTTRMSLILQPWHIRYLHDLKAIDVTTLNSLMDHRLLLTRHLQRFFLFYRHLNHHKHHRHHIFHTIWAACRFLLLAGHHDEVPTPRRCSQEDWKIGFLIEFLTL